MERASCGHLTNVMFKNNQLLKHERNDLEILTYNAENHRFSSVDVRNQIKMRDFDFNPTKMVKTIGNFVFGVCENENGDEFV